MININISERIETTSIEAVMIKYQHRWTGHVIRMGGDRCPEKVLCGEL